MLVNVPRITLSHNPLEKTLCAPTTHRHGYLNACITDLAKVIDMDAIRAVKISIGVDPLGGAGVLLPRADHLRRIMEEAQTIVGVALAALPQPPGIPSEQKLKEKP
jgi:phosphoglucomutase